MGSYMNIIADTIDGRSLRLLPDGTLSPARPSPSISLFLTCHWLLPPFRCIFFSSSSTSILLLDKAAAAVDGHTSVRDCRAKDSIWGIGGERKRRRHHHRLNFLLRLADEAYHPISSARPAHLLFSPPPPRKYRPVYIFDYLSIQLFFLPFSSALCSPRQLFRFFDRSSDPAAANCCCPRRHLLISNNDDEDDVIRLGRSSNQDLGTHFLYY